MGGHMPRERSAEERDGGSKREVSMGAAKMLRRTILGALVVSAALSLPPLLVDGSQYLSYRDTFDKIRLGMSQGEAMTILIHDDVVCSLTLKTGCCDCAFSDFWRVYHISFDPQTRTINGKFFRFKQRANLLERALRNIRRWRAEALPAGQTG